MTQRKERFFTRYTSMSSNVPKVHCFILKLPKYLWIITFYYFFKIIFIQLTGLGSLEDFGQKSLAEFTLSLILREKFFFFLPKD